MFADIEIFSKRLRQHPIYVRSWHAVVRNDCRIFLRARNAFRTELRVAIPGWRTEEEGERGAERKGGKRA